MQEVSQNSLKYSSLYSENDCTLQGSVKDKTVYLKLIKGKGLNKKIYQSEISNNGNPELEKLFDEGEDLLAYMMDKQNYTFEQQPGVITLLGKHPTKKSQRVQLHKLILEQKILEEESVLKKIIDACSGDQIDYDKKVLNWAIKQIAEKLEYLISEKTSPQQNNRIIQKIEVMGGEIQNIKMKFSDFATQNEIIQNKIQLKHENMGIKLQHVKECGEQLKAFVNDSLIRSENKIMKLYQDLQEQRQIVKCLKDKLNLLAEDSKMVEPEMSRIKNEDREAKIMEEKEVLTKLDRTAKFFKHFIVKGINITKQDDFIFPTILFGAPFGDRKEFTVKIKKMGILKKIYPGVCIGVVDSKHKHKQSCDNNDNVIQFGCGGKLFEKNKYLRTEQKGFEAGDTIHVKMETESRKISWYVNGSLRCSLTSDLVVKAEIDWRPYVFMRDKGDSIDWILN